MSLQFIQVGFSCFSWKPFIAFTNLLLGIFFSLSIFTFTFKQLRQCLRWEPDDIQWVAIPPEIKFLLLYHSYTLPNNSWQNLLLQGELSDHIALGIFLDIKQPYFLLPDFTCRGRTQIFSHCLRGLLKKTTTSILFCHIKLSPYIPSSLFKILSLWYRNQGP